MKRIFIAMLAVVVLFATSCSDDEVTPMLKLSQKSVTFKSNGGEQAITVTSNVDWKVQSPSWITVKKEEKQFILNVAPTKSLDALKGEVKVTAGNLVEIVKVTQEALVGEATITPENIELESGEGTVKVKVVANIDSWTAEANVDWLTVTAKPKDSELLIKYSKNASTEGRAGVITIMVGKTKKIINVKQAEMVGDATITPENLELESKAGSIKVKVVANFDNWTAKADVDWLTVTPKPKNNELLVEYTKNDGSEERTGIITVTIGKTEKTINVKQAGDVLTFIMPYVDYTKKVTPEEVDKFEKERGSTTKGMKYGSIEYQTQSKVFPKTSYFFVNNAVDTAYALTTPDVMKKNMEGFVAFLKEKGFKAIAGSTTMYVNEKLAVKATIIIQANIAGVSYLKYGK